uniref:Uncharacterized protein n=1 Tax=Arion vulgaris TaxID=1028688 RepID=A0A0B7A380_9EUPU
MFQQNTATIMNMARTITLVLTAIICTFAVSAEDTNEFYSELPMSNTNTAIAQLSSDQTSNNKLSNLLKFTKSMSDILSQNYGTDIKEPDYGEQQRTYELAKRIFCNGFTGCGIRIRGRRRIQEPVSGLEKHMPAISKRPFCNSYGCYNSGKKRSHSPSENKNDTPDVAGSKVKTFTNSWPWARIKKLFCNSYGGCQNLGKRLSQLNADITKDASNGQHQLSLPVSKATFDLTGGKKRFFTSNFDEEIDSLLDNMRR